MIIAIDAMGGDKAPDEIVKGAFEAVKYYDTEIILVGNESIIKDTISKYGFQTNPRISIVHAEQVISMEDHPAQIIRSKRDSSLHAAVRLVKEGKADAVFSAGNTGATMAVSMITLRTLPGISRPAIATVLPSAKGHSIIIDAGANVDSKPSNYLQFAIMGSAYAKSILNIDKPTVGLLSIGEEDGKGNEMTKTVFTLLKNCSVINFKGNIEPKEMYQGKVDVIVCDGFVGNIALKSSEGVASLISSTLKKEFTSSLLRKISYLFVAGVFNNFKKRIDPEEYGGAPLLGVGGICIIGHGSSSSNAVKNAVRVASDMVKRNMNEAIKSNVQNSLDLLKTADDDDSDKS